MAQKRMFDKSIIETDDFLDLGMATKALYFLLGMEADDEGFVSPKRVMRLYGGNDDDLKVLKAKGFVIQFESGVVVITDWKENNYLDRNRIKETRHKAEKDLLSLENNRYVMLNKRLTGVQPVEKSIEEKRGEENSIYHEQSSKDIDVIFNIFYKSINPTINWGNKTSRKSAAELIKRFGLEKVKGFAQAACQAHGQDYAPTISTPHQLKEKLTNLKAFYDRKKKETSSVDIIS